MDDLVAGMGRPRAGGDALAATSRATAGGDPGAATSKPAAGGDAGAATSPTRGSNPLWGDDWSEVRAMWPLEPTVAHLNHGSCGAVPRPVLEEQQSWRDRMETNPVRFFARELPGALDEARAEVAHFFGTAADNLAFVDNVTTAMSTVLASFPLLPGDQVLLTDHAYGSVRLAVERWAAAARAEVVTAPVALLADDAAVLDAVRSAVTSRTKLAVIEQVTSPTARAFPLVSLIDALHEHQVAVVVDGAHAPAMLDVQLDRLGADFYAGNLHIWGCAPRGTAMLHAAPQWHRHLRPLVAGRSDLRGFPAAFDDTGTRDVTGWLAAGRALRVLGHLGWERVRRHNVQLALAGQEAVAAAMGGPDRLPRDAAVSMQLIPLPDGVAGSWEQAAAIQARFSEQARVEVGVTSWRGQGFIRVSAQVYNAPADYERLAAALPGVLSSIPVADGDHGGRPAPAPPT